MSEPTREELFTKYVRYWKVRCIVSLVSGTLGVLGGILGLQQLRSDRRAYQAGGSKP